MILIGLFGIGIASFIYALARSFTILLISRLLQGLFASFTYSAVFAYIADIYPPYQRGSKMGLIGGLIGVGMIIGPFCGGILADLGGLWLPFVLCAVIAMVAFGLAILFLTETRHESIRNQPFSLRLVFANFNLMMVAVIIALVTILWGSLEVVYPLHVSLRFGCGMTYLGIVFGIGSAIFAAVRYLSGSFSDRYGRRPLFLLGIFILIFGTFFLVIAPSKFLIGFALGIVFLAYGLFFGVAPALLTDIITHAKIPGLPYGAASGLYNISWSLAFFLGASGGGAFLDLVGFDMLHMGYTVLISICFLLAYFFCSEPKDVYE